jgi:hypothetical protein
MSPLEEWESWYSLPGAARATAQTPGTAPDPPRRPFHAGTLRRGMMVKKKKFGGELDEPLPPLNLGLFMEDEEVQKAITNRSELEIRKLGLLKKHYGLEQGNYLGLSFALANEFVDGFKEAKPRGRRQKWTDSNLGFLYVEVERKRSKQGLRGNAQSQEIFAELAMQAPWDSFLESTDSTGVDPDPAEAIRKAYFEAKKRKWSRILLDAFRWHEETETVDEWEEMVLLEVSNGRRGA